MIHSIPSSSSLSGPLSVVLLSAVDDNETTTSCRDQPSTLDINESPRPAKKLQKNNKTVDSPKEESWSYKQIETDLGDRSSTSPTEGTSQDKFFGLTQEFSFTQCETSHSPPFQTDPSFQSFIEALPEEAFAESRPQNGRWGLDRYLATPRNEDAVRYFRP